MASLSDSIQDNSAEQRDLIIQLLQEQALDITTVSHLLHVMADTYVKVSGRHVLGQLAGLARLLAARDDEERNSWMARLDSDSTQAREDIKRIISGTKAKYARDVVAKRTQLETAIAAMGGVTAAEEQRIQDGFYLGEGVNSRTNDIVPEAPEDPWNVDDLLG